MKTTVDSRPTARALLIGIDEYPKLPPGYNLHGCVNDVELMARTLQEHFGFPEDNITILRNSEATRQGICSAMDVLVDQTKEGDVVVVHYSGHGSRVTDVHGDEPSGMDSTIVPYDSGRRWNPTRDILDDEIHVWLSKLSEKTRFVTLIFDSCHSGTITRDMFGEAARWVEFDDRPPDQMELDLTGSPLSNKAITGLTRGGQKGWSGWLALSDRYVLLAGCRDEEKSYELPVTDGADTRRFGALTYFLNQELVKAAPRSTYREVFERARRNVSAAYSVQTPQIEGRQDRELFGVRDITPLRFIRVTERREKTISLAAGAAHGLTEGSEWAIYPQGTRTVDGNEDAHLGVARITRVGALVSDAILLEGAREDAIGPDCRAVEEARSVGHESLRVEVAEAPADLEPHAEALKQQVGGSRFLHLVKGKESPDATADVRVYLIAPRDRVNEARDAVPQLGPLSQAMWAAVDRTGLEVMPAHGINEPDVLSILLDNLELLARYRNAITLNNPNPDNPLRGKVDLVLKRKVPGGVWEKATPDREGGEIVFDEGDCLAVEIVNRYDAPVYISLLDFGQDSTITLVYPPERPSERLEKNRTVTLFERPEDELEVHMPSTVPHDRGQETLKLFVSTAESDFSWLQQEGTRGDLDTAEECAPRSLSLLDRLFAFLYLGGGTRNLVPRKSPPKDEWLAVDQQFAVRRRR